MTPPPKKKKKTVAKFKIIKKLKGANHKSIYSIKCGIPEGTIHWMKKDVHL
jgi:hypothetical protein